MTLLIARLLLALLRRASRPDRLRPLRSWPGTALRWFGRRPARSVVAMVLCALAVAFGTTVTSFTATYTTARAADRASALGSDLRLAPPVNVADPPPPVAGVASTSPIRVLPARVGTDRKLISTVDLATYSSTVTVPERLLAGQGVSGLAADPSGVLINKELTGSLGRTGRLVAGDRLPGRPGAEPDPEPARGGGLPFRAALGAAVRAGHVDRRPGRGAPRHPRLRPSPCRTPTSTW